MMMSTGPIGWALLGLGIAIVTTFLVAAAIHNIYIDARFLAGKQLEEINGLVKLLGPNAEEEPQIQGQLNPLAMA